MSRHRLKWVEQKNTNVMTSPRNLHDIRTHIHQSSNIRQPMSRHQKGITNVKTSDIQCQNIDSETHNNKSMSRHRVRNVAISAKRKRKEDPGMSRHKTAMSRHQSSITLRQCRNTIFDPQHSSFNVVTSPRHCHDID